MGRQGSSNGSKRQASNRTTAKEVLKEAETLNLEVKQACKEFQNKHKYRLSKDSTVINNSSQTKDEKEVLHILAEDFGETKKHARFLKWVIMNFNNLLNLTVDGQTPLHLALSKCNHEFVKIILKHGRDMRVLLNKNNYNETCLHFAIRYKSPFCETLIEKIQEIEARIEKAPEIDVVEANTSSVPNPVNSSISVDIFTAKYMGKPFKGMTPLHMSMRFDAESDITNHETEPTNLAVTPPRIMENDKPISYDLMHSEGISGPIDGDNAEENLAANSSSSYGTFNLQRIVEKLINARPQVLVECEDGNGETPFQARLSYLHEMTAEKGTDAFSETGSNIDQDSQGAGSLPAPDHSNKASNNGLDPDQQDKTPLDSHYNSQESSKNGSSQNVPRFSADATSATDSKLEDDFDLEVIRQNEIENDCIAKYMREYIISNFHRKDAIKALYKVGDEHSLEFDLSGLPYLQIDQEYLDGLGKCLKFENTLKYVALPRLAFEVSEGLQNQPTTRRLDHQNLPYGKNNKGKGVQHMLSIFQWLKSRRVKSILKVTVVDNVEPSHSDEVIEICLEGLDIRYWNWFKVDLCCDVIQRSAPRVKDVILYSSGNNAALKGWSSPSGLAKLEELEKVQIYVQEGLESHDRLETYMKNFKREIETEFQKQNRTIEVWWRIHKPDSNYDTVFNQRATEPASESKWMKTMTKFAEFLKNAKPGPYVSPIKIAVIDDGIDTKLDIFTNRIQGGQSFHGQNELSGRWGAYYVPSGYHGTLMAQLICEVCPVVKLYIAQLEVIPGNDGQRAFTVSSATDAITWAVQQGVDIISMSWSIRSKEPLNLLINALNKASSEKIISFCASIDEGAAAIDNTYPGKVEACIKIGASTGTGSKLSWVSERESDFLLPGEALHHGSDIHAGTFGSSVSTAIAAGLAGVLLYCDRLIDLKEPSAAQKYNKNDPERPLDKLRNTGSIRAAFKKLSSGTELNKFPQVWDHFPSGNLQWNDGAYPKETEDTFKILKEFMKKLHE